MLLSQLISTQFYIRYSHFTLYTEESVCIVYINGRYAFTNRIYDLAKNPWAIFCTEGEVTVSDIKLSTY